MSYIDKQEYEERYGDHVGYCRVHHITVLDTCQLCEDDEANVSKYEECAQCHSVDTKEDYTWTEIDGELRLLCWDCTDTIRKAGMLKNTLAELVKDARAASILNVDYIH